MTNRSSQAPGDAGPAGTGPAGPVGQAGREVELLESGRVRLRDQVLES